jgi:hypothetical protein
MLFVTKYLAADNAEISKLSTSLSVSLQCVRKLNIRKVAASEGAIHMSEWEQIFIS